MQNPLTILRARSISSIPVELTACKHCTKPFKKAREWQLFCSSKCKNDHNNASKLSTEASQAKIRRLEARIEELELALLDYKMRDDATLTDEEMAKLEALDNFLNTT